MAMLIVEKDLNPEGKFGWFNYERRNWLAVVVAVGAAAYGAGNGHTTQNAVVDIAQKSAAKTAVIKRLETKDIPVLKAKVGCEHWRAQVTEQVAKDAIKGATSDAAPIPSPAAIPADNCDPAAPPMRGSLP